MRTRMAMAGALAVATILGTTMPGWAEPPERPAAPGGRGFDGAGDGGPREGRGGPRPGRGPDGPPSPERFVERAMKFDADGDGKLDRDELLKFAEEMQAMRTRGGPQGGPDGFRGGGGPGRGPGAGRGPEDGERRRGPPPGGPGERPDRPPRPE